MLASKYSQKPIRLTSVVGRHVVHPIHYAFMQGRFFLDGLRITSRKVKWGNIENPL
jgi:hypothetical protein